MQSAQNSKNYPTCGPPSSGLCGKNYSKDGRRYRYYTSQAVIRKQRKPSYLDRIPAQELERLVYTRIQVLLASPQELSSACAESTVAQNEFNRLIEAAQQLAGKWPDLSSEQLAELVRRIVLRIVVRDSEAEIEIDVEAQAVRLLGDDDEGPAIENRRPHPGARGFRLACPFHPAHRRGELRLVLPGSRLGLGAERPNHSIVRAIARSLQWRERIVAGDIHSKEELAAEAGLNASYVGRILRIAALSPDLVDSLTRLGDFSDYPLTGLVNRLPLDWRRQKSALLNP